MIMYLLIDKDHKRCYYTESSRERLEDFQKTFFIKETKIIEMSGPPEEKETMKTYTLTLDSINKVLAYLSNRPYSEVSGLINDVLLQTNAQDAAKTPTNGSGKVSEEVKDLSN